MESCTLRPTGEGIGFDYFYEAGDIERRRGPWDV
jgi:hypothetical protein